MNTSCHVLGPILVLCCVLAGACKEVGPSRLVSPTPPDWVCGQPIPGSAQSIYRFRYDSEYAFTDDMWGYAITDSPAKIGKHHLHSFPAGRLYRITDDGTVHLVRALSAATRSSESVHHVVAGVSVVEHTYRTDGRSMNRRFRFDSIASNQGFIVLTGVRGDDGAVLHDRLDIPGGGFVAHERRGFLLDLEVVRLDPDSSESKPGELREAFHDTFLPAQGLSIPMADIPARGVCKPIPMPRRSKG